MSIANAFSFDAIRDFIFISEKPQKADLILIPGAPVKELAIHGAELYNEGYAPMVLATGKYYMKYKSLTEEFETVMKEKGGGLGQETEAEYLKVLLTEHGVPDSAIVLEKESMNTFENAINASKIIHEMSETKEIKHIILCCQAFHARRALMTFQSELRGLKITVCPVITRNIGPDTWMDTQKGYDLVLGELSKCGDYFKGERMYDLR